MPKRWLLVSSWYKWFVGKDTLILEYMNPFIVRKTRTCFRGKRNARRSTGRRWYRFPPCICVWEAVSFFDAVRVTPKNSGMATRNGYNKNVPISIISRHYNVTLSALNLFKYLYILRVSNLRIRIVARNGLMHGLYPPPEPPTFIFHPHRLMQRHRYPYLTP